MGFRDIFKQKLHVERVEQAEIKAKEDVQKHEASSSAAQLDPKLRALVLEVFAAMEAEGVVPVDVTDDVHGHNKTGVKAYALGRLLRGRWGGSPKMPVVIDSEGQIAYDHYVTALGDPPVSIISCATLDEGYERVLAAAHNGSDPTRTGLHLDAGGVIIRTTQHTDYDNSPTYRSAPLAEYLAELAAHTVARG